MSLIIKAYYHSPPTSTPAIWACVAHYPEGDLACWVVSERDNPEWRRPRGQTRGSWVVQANASCWELLGVGRRGDWWVDVGG